MKIQLRDLLGSLMILIGGDLFILLFIMNVSTSEPATTLFRIISLVAIALMGMGYRQSSMAIRGFILLWSGWRMWFVYFLLSMRIEVIFSLFPLFATTIVCMGGINIITFLQRKKHNLTWVITTIGA